MSMVRANLKEETTKALAEYGFVPDDLPFALFYKGDSILSPFGCNHDIIIKCIGLIQLASAHDRKLLFPYK